MRVAVDLVPPRPGAVPSASVLDPGRTTAVVVDVLRATSTLTVALSNGASGVVALAETDAALELRARRGDVLACGEREGRIVPGFDLGNSPFEYEPGRVAGKTLAFASTNGSLALRAAHGSRRRVLGAFVNAGAVLEAVKDAPQVRIVCAGKLGRFALEDAAFAGWLCARLAERGAAIEGAPARLALALAPRGAAGVRAAVEGASHGRYLRRLGPEFARDVSFCATLDAVDRAFEV